MNERAARCRSGSMLPEDAPAGLTSVELTWQEGRIEHWIRFGRPVWERILDRHRRVVGFAPGAVFALVRWASNEYGTAVSRIAILRAIEPGAPYQTLPCVRPGGELLMAQHGWPKVERVLLGIDAIEALAIQPADVSPDYWRHLHNRLSVGQEAHPYYRSQHRAWLQRRSVLQ